MKRTKFFVATLFTSLFVCLCMLFSGCQFTLLTPNGSEDVSDNTSENISEDTVAGVYKVKSGTFTQGETTQEFQVGETMDNFPMGERVGSFTLTEDFMKIILTEDGYFVMDAQNPVTGSQDLGIGTWSQSEEGKIIVSVKYIPQEIVLEYDGSTITWSLRDDFKIILEKKAITLSTVQAQAMGYYKLKSITSSSGESIDISTDFYGRYDLSLILTKDGCGYVFFGEYEVGFSGGVGTWTQAENGKFSITVAPLTGECDGSKITATLDNKTYVFEK